MVCILAPEMSFGDSKSAKRGLGSRLGSSRSRTPAPVMPRKADQPAHRTLGSIFSSNYDSVKSSVRRAASVRVTKRERQVTRAQDIFTKPDNVQDRPNTLPLMNLRDEEAAPVTVRGRSVTPMSTLSLDKPLPALPTEPVAVDEDAALVEDNSLSEFAGYLDLLANAHHDLPSEEEVEPDESTGGESASPAQDSILPAPKEEEWMSTRPDSQLSSTNTMSAASDETRRQKSRPQSVALTRSTSGSGKTVTPMSSIDSERGLRGVKRTLSGPPRIEEVSEGTASPFLTPKRRSAAGLNTCYHCGRDPSGGDVKRKNGSPMTVLDLSKYACQDEDEPVRGKSTNIVAQDKQGKRYALDLETSQFRVMDETEECIGQVPKTPEQDAFFDFSGVVRPSNPDPYDTTLSSPDELPQHRQGADFEIEDDNEASEDLENTPPGNIIANRAFYDRLLNLDGSSLHGSPSNSRLYEQTKGREEREFDAEAPHSTSFWKNPDGVILVYQGLEIGGKELYYGSDINYLGAFQDDDEGSSGLGSTRNSSNDLAGAGGGLAMIPEVGGSEELWDDDAFEGQ